MGPEKASERAVAPVSRVIRLLHGRDAAGYALEYTIGKSHMRAGDVRLLTFGRAYPQRAVKCGWERIDGEAIE